MAAPKYTDRLRAQNVRSMGLDIVADLFTKYQNNTLDTAEMELFKIVFPKIASTLLPRLNEHTGEEGGAIIIKQIMYGSDNPPQIPTESISNTIPPEDPAGN